MGDPDNYELSEYERQRLERIRKNEAYLESLGLNGTKTKLMEMTQKTRRNQQRAKTKKAAAVKPGEERRSRRIRKDGTAEPLLMLSYADPNHVASPSAVRQGSERAHADHPSPSFRSSSIRRINLSRQEDFVLTQEEKDVLAKNTMDSNYLQKFKEFLVYHNKISDQNVRNVMRQVTKLASGEGVRYESPKYGWKPHQVFQKGVPVTPLSDFVHLMELAREAENAWGRDHGNGWLLSHPLKKMLLFQQFCLQNPDFLSSESRLGEYYAEQNFDESVSGEEDEEEARYSDTSTPPDIAAVVTSSDSDEGEQKAGDDEGEPEETKKRGLPRQDPSPQPSTKKKKGEAGDKHVGMRVAKSFGDDIHLGTIQKYDAESKYWFVVYDDGDEEELDSKELQLALQLFQEPAKEDEKGDDDRVGCRVARKFGGEVYVGTVKKYDAKLKYWFVVYDDGDKEELDSKELQRALKLFQERNVEGKKGDDQVGSRVARKFDDEVYVGTVKKYNARSKYWLVVYDDDDREELDSEELIEALELFEEHEAGTAKSSPKKRKRPRK